MMIKKLIIMMMFIMMMLMNMTMKIKIAITRSIRKPGGPDFAW